MPSPVVITGGGTGGHVFAMQAIADALVARGVDPGDLRFVGSVRGQDAALLGSGPISLTLLGGRGLRRSWTPGAVGANLVAAAGLAGAVARAWGLVRRWRPRAVVSVGGYASFPASLAAILLRRPLVLVELDAAPGSALRVFASRAAARCVAFDDGSGAVVTGAPVREAIASLDRSVDAIARRRRAADPPLDDERAVVVVMTGSLGSQRVNSAVLELARLWSERRDRAILHVTGRRDFERVNDARPLTPGLDYRVEAFADMTRLWGLCDVAVCRAGATTVAELTTLGIASVLVPLPGAPGDHQSLNARALASVEAAVVVRDADCTGVSLASALDGLLVANRLRAAGAAARSLGHADAAARIAAVVLEAAGPS